MANLFEALRTGADTLRVYQRALDVVQNNVSNANTPGFAKQSLILAAQPFDVAGGLAGGVSGKDLASARSEYAEDEVRRQSASMGFYDAQTQASGSLERLFDVSGTGGVPAALTNFFQSVSSWSVAPQDTNERHAVIAAAGEIAGGVQALSAGLENASNGIDSQISSTVEQVNRLTGTIQKFNVKRAGMSAPDPGEDANVHAALEQLADLVDTTTLIQPDGAITVLLNGGAPLVMGSSQYGLQTSRDESAQTTILDQEGHDVSSQIDAGQLGGMLEASRALIPGAKASLNRFSQMFAVTVNGILTSGTVAPGDATAGAPLFSYISARPAATLAVNASITAADLAPVDSKGNANGNALKLASLANSSQAGGIDSQAFGDFFSGIAAAAGRASAAAQQNLQTQQQVVAQTRSMRDQLSGVSLDEQAISLMQFQRSYQAAAKLVTTLNDMVGDVINLIR